jgi:hypothetical protein
MIPSRPATPQHITWEKNDAHKLIYESNQLPILFVLNNLMECNSNNLTSEPVCYFFQVLQIGSNRQSQYSEPMAKPGEFKTFFRSFFIQKSFVDVYGPFLPQND